MSEFICDVCSDLILIKYYFCYDCTNIKRHTNKTIYSSLEIKPIHQLKGLQVLTILELEKKIDSHIERQGSDMFTKKKVELFFDLSQCRFSKLGAIAKLILILDHYISFGDSVYIALPTIGKTQKEKESKNFADADEKGNIIEKRTTANRFLHSCGFVNAINKSSEIHDNLNVFFTEKYNFESESFNAESFKSSFSEIFEKRSMESYNYKFLLPFNWINCSIGMSAFDEIGNEFDKILSNPERGIESLDVKAIKNVVISELIKNVNEHSGQSYALLSIGLLDIKAYKKIDESDIQYNYLNWVTLNGFVSQVEIYFGDSGTGILNEEYQRKYPNPKNNSLDYSKEQLKLAFQKWTSTKDNNPRRGTKGLYRIQRIVNKYNGIVYIDTSNHQGGFQKGGEHEAKYIYKKNDNNFQGTLINIKLNPYRQIQAFNYKLRSEDKNFTKKWSSSKVVIDEKLECLTIIKDKIKYSNNLLLILDVGNFNIVENKDKFEDILYEVSRDSHPCAVVIYFIDNEQIDNYSISDHIDSVNTRIIKDHDHDVFPEVTSENAEDIHDPVLVLGSDSQAYWYGGSNELIEVLKDGFGKVKNLEQLESFRFLTSNLQTKIKLYLENDATLVNLFKGEIAYNFIDIDNHYEETIRLYSKELDKRFCSPKLQVSKYWLNVKSILEKNVYGFALCLYLKFREEYGIETVSKDSTYIIIDHGQQRELAKALADLLGIEFRKIKNITSDLNFEIPRRTGLFESNSKVIVLTSIISSSETARRLVKYARRDFSLPSVILCLANFRKNRINNLETWNETTKIISCYQHNKSESPKEVRDFDYFTKKSKELKINDFEIKTPQFEKEPEEIQPIKLNTELLGLLTNNKLLHYNHIGVYNKRHFTFYVNKKRLLGLKESIIYDKIEEKIDDWLNRQELKNFHIYVSDSIYYKISGFLEFLNKVTNSKVKKFYKNRPTIVNEANVIYLDFGILTGNSINSFITNTRGVDNLFVLIIFNQSLRKDTNVFDRISQLNYNDPFTGFKSKNTTLFNIDYLFKLPLDYFNSENCPICEHRRALNEYKIQNEYLSTFAEDRRDKLIQTEDSLLYDFEYPVDYYYSELNKDHELSSNIIKEMYSFKILLENAKIHTSYRIKLFNYTYEIYSNKEILKKDCESKLYGVLYFLSHEIHWFQIEPLIFRDFRIMISEISQLIACEERNKLIEFFENSNKSHTLTDKLIVRYKYAAISVLRSTHKLNFCKCVYNIIASSLLNEKFSNNLIQNTLYHISSLHKNRYNKSLEYFYAIKDNLEKVIDLKFLTILQKLAIQKLIVNNSSIIKSIKNPNPNNEVDRFIKMKTDWENLYDETPRHPKPFQLLKTLSLKRHNNTFKTLAEGDISADQLMLLNEIINSLQEKWHAVRKILKNDLYHYLVNDLPYLTNSDFYQNNYSNYLEFIIYNKKVERFSELVLLISKDLKQYKHHEEEYDQLYKYFEDTFVKEKGLTLYTDNSEILDMLSQFPSNLSELIDCVFPNELFLNKVINIKPPLKNNGKWLVYFPKSLLRLNLELVRENLKQRLVNGVELKDVNILFEIEQINSNNLQLIIKYDSTENIKDRPEDKKGALTKWKKELIQFGGALSFQKPTLVNPNFTLEIIFLKYDRF